MNSEFPQADGSTLQSHGESSLGALTAVANRCTSGNCPTVYAASGAEGTIVVQGYSLSTEDAGVNVPAGEALVRIPVDLLLEAARNLS